MTLALARQIERLGSPHILVLGDLMLDHYVWGRVDRISPEAPIQVLNAESEEHRPGGASNVACNLVALGARVRCAGSVGNDDRGRRLTAMLKKRGVDTRSIVVDPRKPTPIKTRMIAHNQQVLRVDREKTEPLSRSVQNSLMRAIRSGIRRCRLVLISDYNKGTVPPALCREVIALARKNRIPVIAGPKGKDLKKFRGTTGAAMNRSELLGLTGADTPDRGARALLKAWAMEFLVVTLGEKGMALYTREGKTYRIPTVARQVYDVTGAGDTALAAFGLAFAGGMGLEEALMIANAAAGIVVGKVGTETATRPEIARVLSAGSLPVHEGKILTVSQLADMLARHRENRRSIVFTNGCFDLMHAGHIQTLSFAKSHGDVLVVGLNSDRSVRRIKGPSRPILSQKDRARVLAAIEHVDYVVVFDEATPLHLIRQLKPDVLVKGQDWAGKEVVGSGDVERYGGRVVLAPLIHGISTSDVVERIRRGRK